MRKPLVSTNPAPRARQTLLATTTTLLLATATQGCASSSSSPVVLRVGKVAIERAPEIAERLAEERHAHVLAGFLESLRREWSAKTSCEAGFIVQRCSGYRGRLVAEGELLGT